DGERGIYQLRVRLPVLTLIIALREANDIVECLAFLAFGSGVKVGAQIDEVAFNNDSAVAPIAIDPPEIVGLRQRDRLSGQYATEHAIYACGQSLSLRRRQVTGGRRDDSPLGLGDSVARRRVQQRLHPRLLDELDGIVECHLLVVVVALGAAD